MQITHVKCLIKFSTRSRQINSKWHKARSDQMGQVNIYYVYPQERHKFYLSRIFATRLARNGLDLINGRPFALGRNDDVCMPNIWSGSRKRWYKWKRLFYATFSVNFSQTHSDKHLMLYETMKSNHMLCHNEIYVYIYIWLTKLL